MKRSFSGGILRWTISFSGLYIGDLEIFRRRHLSLLIVVGGNYKDTVILRGYFKDGGKGFPQVGVLR